LSDTDDGVSIHMVGCMHSIDESMHRAGLDMIFYLLIYLLYNCFPADRLWLWTFFHKKCANLHDFEKDGRINQQSAK